MRFDDKFLDDIRARVPLSDVVGQHVVWDQRKTNISRRDYWACCPFHDEKTPSFHADDQRGRYHCFGCHKSGDHFRFLMDKTGVSFPEAVEILANRAGLKMPQQSAVAAQKAEKKKSFEDILQVSAQYYQKAYQDTVGGRARGYMRDREVPVHIQSQFGIGYAPQEKDGLKNYLLSLDIDLKDMIASGALARSDDGRVYDRFRNRLMFPIHDIKGRVIGFGGRALDSVAHAKYLNSAESSLFQKRHTLYNIHRARQAAHEGQIVLVVEGYMDVLACTMAGFEAAVAPLGTALTNEQIILLWRLADVPVICFDGDRAGQKAALRAIDTALPLLTPGKSIRFAFMPKGQDPDDVIRTQGNKSFQALIDQARPLVDILWQSALDEGALNTPEERAAFEIRLKNRIRVIKNETVARYYRDDLSQRLRQYRAAQSSPVHKQQFASHGFKKAQFYRQGQFGAHQRQTIEPSNPGKSITRSGLAARIRHASTHEFASTHELLPREALLVMLAVKHPFLIEQQLETFAELDFEGNILKKLQQHLLDFIATDSADLGDQEVEKRLYNHLVGLGLEEVLKSLESRLLAKGIWQMGKNAAKQDIETTFAHALALHYKSRELNKELKQAELALGKAPSEESFERLKEIQNQVVTVDGTQALIQGFGVLSGR